MKDVFPWALSPQPPLEMVSAEGGLPAQCHTPRLINTDDTWNMLITPTRKSQKDHPSFRLPVGLTGLCWNRITAQLVPSPICAAISSLPWVLVPTAPLMSFLHTILPPRGCFSENQTCNNQKALITLTNVPNLQYLLNEWISWMSDKINECT